MTANRLNKHTEARVVSAFKWAQKRVGTAFDLTFIPLPKEERADSTMTCRRGGRGEADKTAFVIEVDPAYGATEVMKKLRILAIHEILHAVWWPVIEVVETRALAADRTRVIAEIESATYICQRAIAGDVE